jgi:Transmembrane amino acid transporter protein
MLIGFAPLTKLSVDLVVDLSSCPSVIERARSKERNYNRHGLETDSHVSSDHIDDCSDDFDEETTDLRNVPSENNGIEDTSACPNNFMKTVESSPLMARDEEEDHTSYETRDLFRTPSKSLVSSDVTQRRLSSLHFETNDSSKNATTALECNNSFHRPCCGYEDVGYAAFGSSGRVAVLVSKFLYAFGCLVAFVVVVRDNFGVSVRGMTFGPSSSNDHNVDCDWLYDDNYLALLVSAVIMLPLSCSRTMTSLSIVSFASILSTLCLMVIVAYMFFTCTNAVGRQDKSFYENWIEVRSLSGVIQSLGCFAFTYVGHHTVNPAYESLPLPIRNPKTWRRISTNAMILALEASLGVGAFAYLTFGSQAPSDVVSRVLV